MLIQTPEFLPRSTSPDRSSRYTTENYAQESGQAQFDYFIIDSLRKISWVYIYWLAFGLFLSLNAYYYSATANISPLSSIRLAGSIYYLFLATHVAYRFKTGGSIALLAPDILFLGLYTLVHLGYITLYSLNVVPFHPKIFYYYDSYIAKAMLIINLGLIGFLLGSEIVGIIIKNKTQRKSITPPGVGWSVFGIALLVLGIIMHFSGLYMLGFEKILQEGYAAIQRARDYSSYFTTLLLSTSIYASVFGLTTYLIGSAFQYGKLFHSKTALALTILIFTMVALEGDRGPILKFGLPVLMVQHYFIKSIKIHYLAAIVIFTMSLFAGLGAVRQTVFNPSKMMEEYQIKKEDQEIHWYSTFLELGGSFLVVNIVSKDVPRKEPYWLGESWKNATIHMVPFLQGTFSRTGIKSGRAPSDWITHSYFGKNASGRAFTVAAEGYINFGLIGAFLEVMGFGIFIRWLTIKFSQNPTVMWAFIMLGCSAACVNVVRNHLNVVSNVLVQVFIVGFVLHRVLERGSLRRLVGQA